MLKSIFQLKSRLRAGRLLGLSLLSFIAGSFPASAFADQYEVLSPATSLRWTPWVSEGIAGVYGSNASAGNRFRLGVDLGFGREYRYLFGLTIFDVLSSGETNSDVGDVSRTGGSLDLGYYLIPNRLWLKYSLYIGEISGSQITGHEGALGHGFSAGYRFYESDSVNLSLELSYQHIQSKTVPAIDLTSGALSGATYPLANAWSLNLRIGFDVSGGSG